MKLLLLYYAKVTNDAFNKFALSSTDLELKSDDLSVYGSKMDRLSYHEVHRLLTQQKPFDAILIGDIFWDTGQNICRWGQDNKVPVFFLQHGQWIYITNKKDPKYLPTATFVYGDKIQQMMSSWEYSKRSKVYVTGNPRYDNISRNNSGEYVYFAPPVMFENVPSAANRTDRNAFDNLVSLKGIDKEVPMLIHPHYREINVPQLKDMFPYAKFADPQIDPLPLIQKSSKVLTHRNSTTVLDAIACGKMTVLMNFREKDKSFFPRDYFGEFAQESDWPSRCMTNLKSNVTEISDYEEKARPYIYLGNASKRIEGIICQWGTE